MVTKIDKAFEENLTTSVTKTTLQSAADKTFREASPSAASVAPLSPTTPFSSGGGGGGATPATATTAPSTAVTSITIENSTSNSLTTKDSINGVNGNDSVSGGTDGGPVADKSTENLFAVVTGNGIQPSITSNTGNTSSGGPQPLHSRSQKSFSINKNEEFHFEVPNEAPLFVPTVDEFKNPLNYISKIRPIAEKYGICKIKPPATWQPPFTVDVDKLKFVPRVQRLNELEAKTRVKLNFLDQIAKFWDLQGSSLKIPMVERKALDLYSLHRIVQDEGGYEQTSRERKWTKVANRLGYPTGKSIGTNLRNHYERILYPFDVFTSGKSEESILEKKLESESDDHDYKPHGILSRQKVTPPKETTARRSQRFVQNTPVKSDIKDDCDDPIGTSPIKDETDGKSPEVRRLQFYGAGPKMSPNFKSRLENGKSRMNGGGGGSASKKNFRKSNTDLLAKYICHICNRGDVEEAMLLCDGCDDSYHTFCLLPPLTDIPKGEWRCPKCVVEEVNKPTEAFGFEQAQREYTLQQFGEMADQFKADYFNIPVHLVPTDLVEREFWRIVSSIDEDVAVEYGADLHTMDHGSGFPTKSSLYLLPGDQEYAESSWNLNNLPLLEESILGHINADISGMKVPWMYVGMCFATFCWHNEDHWSYSINYLHWGEPKTWYGVPGGKAESFENTMKSAAPELFQSQPDLLHQLVTIMNPNILMNAGVPVYRTDQQAGEFVITFPRAYHAGFNQGYNFAEAVNFAPADWMKMGRECINHYSTLRRFCVFSHDELVCKMALDPDKLNLGIATACYLDMAEMVDSEKKLRKSLLEWGVTKAEREAFELIPDDERQCDVCKTTCFLSAVTCTCVKALVCLRHYSELCKCSAEKHTLKYRYTLDELPLMLRKLKIKAESFEIWLTKVRDVIDPNTPTTIKLDELQELAMEAEEKKFPNSVLLERLNSAVLEAEKCVTVIQQLDINKMRTRTRNSSEFAKYKLTMDELDMFVQEIDNLCCIIEEGNSVRELREMGLKFVAEADELLEEKMSEIIERDIIKLIEDGSSLCIELPQITGLKLLQQQVKWYNSCREVREGKEKATISILQKLLESFKKVTPHTTLERELAEIHEIIYDVEQWELLAKQCFESGTQHEIPEIEELIKRGEQIECYLPSQSMLKDALKKAKEWLSTVDILQTNENYPYFHTLENVVNRGRNIPFQLEELKRMEEHLSAARLWKQRTGRTFLKKSAQFTLMEALSPRSDAVMLTTRSKTHLTEEQFNQQFTEDVGPAQMVLAFKTAEEKELRDMRELRRTNLEKNPEEDKFCICRRRFYGNMFHCQLCKDWFHATCVPVPRNTVRPRPSNSTSPSSTTQNLVPPLTTREKDRETKYLCPSCMRSRRPRLETILTLLVSLQRLPIRLPEGEALQCLTERAMNWQDRARQALGTEDIVAALATLSYISQKTPEETNPPLPSSSSSSSSTTAPASTTSIENLNLTTGTTTCTTASSTTPILSCSSIATLTTTATPTITTTTNNLNNSNLVKENRSNSALKNSSNKKQRLDRNSESTITSSDEEDMLPAFSSPNIEHTLSPVKDVEHAYSVPPAPNYGKVGNNPVQKSDLPLIMLNKTTRDALEDLMMEGDLLEVSLDETQHLWRILNAAKPSVSDLAYIHYRYQILPHSNEGLVNNIRKRRSDENVTNSKKTNTTTGLNNSKNSNNSNKDSTNTPTNKVKRGRKTKTTSLNNGVGSDGKDTSTPTTTAKKKKRGRKSIQENQAALAASTSDEDDECSDSNCSRPTGIEVDWVQCDGGCNKWFHMVCVGLVKGHLKADDDYICKKCKK